MDAWSGKREGVSLEPITALLNGLSWGDQERAAKLMPLVYGELRRLARRYMRRERPGHTLAATALVHEAYMRLAGQESLNWQSRAHFYGFAARVMRQILMEHARRRDAAKRGGHFQRIALDEAVGFQEEPELDLFALDEALNRLATFDPRQCRLVEMRFFGGLTIEETAEALGVSPATVKREWLLAKAWLHRELRGASENAAD